MKSSDKDKLMTELFGEIDDLDAQSRSHALLLREVRHRRFLSISVRISAIAACAVLGFFVLGQLLPSPTAPAVPDAPNQISRVAPMETVHTSMETVEFVSTSSAHFPPVEMVQSTHAGVVQIDDTQLLDLFEGQAIALVAVRPGQKELLFLDELKN